MTQYLRCYRRTNEKPTELDTTSSPTTVYLRKNFARVYIEDVLNEEANEYSTIETPADESATDAYWAFDERQMTIAEYNQYLMLQETKEAITSFQTQEAIDKYTSELIEEGVI